MVDIITLLGIFTKHRKGKVILLLLFGICLVVVATANNISLMNSKDIAKIDFQDDTLTVETKLSPFENCIAMMSDTNGDTIHVQISKDQNFFNLFRKKENIVKFDFHEEMLKNAKRIKIDNTDKVLSISP